MIAIDQATAADLEFLWRMLFYASHSHHEDGVSVSDIKRNPDLVRHLDDWGRRPGDLGLVAWAGNQPVGACWMRHLIGDEQNDVTFVDDTTPELVIAIEPDHIGGRLLQELLALADSNGVDQIVLTARDSNPAVALYERHGFAVVERIVNRVGSGSVKMIRPGTPAKT